MYTAEEKKILEHYFTSTESDVFALINLPEVIKGTLFSRYSRTQKDVRRLFLDEFIGEDVLQGFFANETASLEGVNTSKAEDFYERILVGYGDDSVAELGGCHVAMENISMLATKSIEEHRLGMSPLEKSTRYVYFDQKKDGEYQFYKDQKIIQSQYRDLYLEVNNLLFDTYSKIVRDIQPLLKEIFPGDENETAYKFSIRAKACDIARGLLPLSAYTNMGAYANGRAFEYLLIHLLNDPLEEVRTIGRQMDENLKKVIPAFIKRATNERGEQYREYLQNTEKSLPVADHIEHSPNTYTELTVELADADPLAIEKIIASILYSRSQMPYSAAFEKAKAMHDADTDAIVRHYTALRKNRHHKPGRSFEEAYFAFDVVADWGVYKDLMRHRILTRHHQVFTNELGYWTPQEIVMSGFESEYRRAMDKAVEAYVAIKKDFPHEAQYLVTHGAYNRFYMRMNLRAINHMVELRTSPQGHPTYRKTGQLMAQRVSERFPLLGKYAFPFADFNDYELERLDAFRKIEKKATELGVQGFSE
ncbi:FAD-dependent thymidylate synthase [Candidatus Uhrbacteria bacterium]|nr:FAD-dependent thymidylate synthase [Candidatus Uhrbacteria bacterium]